MDECISENTRRPNRLGASIGEVYAFQNALLVTFGEPGSCASERRRSALHVKDPAPIKVAGSL